MPSLNAYGKFKIQQDQLPFKFIHPTEGRTDGQTPHIL